MLDKRNLYLTILPQLITTLIATSGSILTGMHLGWSAPALPILRSNSSSIHMSKSNEESLEVINVLSGVFLIPLLSYFAWKVGRKWTILFGTILNLLGFILIGLAKTVVYLYWAKVFSALAIAVSYMVTPVYVAEIASENVRGFLTTLNFELLLFGTSLIYILLEYCPYLVHVFVGGALAIIQIFALIFLPESPYFLIGKKKLDKARKALKQLRSSYENVDTEFQEIVKAISEQNQQTGRFLDLFLVKHHRKGIILALFLLTAQSLTGDFAIKMNLHSLFLQLDKFIIDYKAWAIICSILNCVGALFCCATVDIFGRKPLLVFSSILTCFSLISAGIYFHLSQIGYDMSSYQWLVYMSMSVYSIVSKMGLGILPQMLVAEIFADNVKTHATNFCEMFDTFSVTLSIVWYYYLNSIFGLHASFYSFGAAAFVSFIYFMKYIPETKGKTLHEIQTST